VDKDGEKLRRFALQFSPPVTMSLSIRNYDMINTTLHFIIAIVGTFLFTTSITGFHKILSSKFLASNITGLLILLIGFFLAYYSIRFVFKTSLVAFQWLGGILAWLISNSLIWHESRMFIALTSVAITVFLISKYRNKINDNEKNAPDSATAAQEI